MAKKLRASREIWKFWVFGHNFMANNRIGMFFSLNDSFWCAKSNDIWINWIRSDLLKLQSIVRKMSSPQMSQHDWDLVESFWLRFFCRHHAHWKKLQTWSKRTQWRYNYAICKHWAALPLNTTQPLSFRCRLRCLVSVGYIFVMSFVLL